jgi:hypothetical protein
MQKAPPSLLLSAICAIGALVACGEPPADSADPLALPSGVGVEQVGAFVADARPPGKGDGPIGFIGGPCEVDADCDYEGGTCITAEGFSRGTCSQACDQLCPDADGHPTTFCVERDELPADAQDASAGSCLSRCDFGLFPGSGCRVDYACVERHRANEPDTAQFVCLPEGEDVGLPDCILELGYLGVDFEPTTIPDTSPEGTSEVCHVQDAVILHPPVHGVDLKYYDGSATPNVRMSCEGAKALVQTVDDMKPHGVTAVRHIGTYVCRTIAGTSTLSKHSFGDAIDIFGFELDDGSLVTLEDHWEHDTEDPVTEEAQLLYDASWRWFDSYIWNIILTPNYNAAHDNHFHVDLTPGSHFRGAGAYRHWGVNQTGD